MCITFRNIANPVSIRIVSVLQRNFESILSKYHILLLRKNASTKMSVTSLPQWVTLPLKKGHGSTSQGSQSTKIPTQWPTTSYTSERPWIRKITAPPPSRFLCKHSPREGQHLLDRETGSPFDFDAWMTLFSAMKNATEETDEETQQRNAWVR